MKKTIGISLLILCGCSRIDGIDDVDKFVQQSKDVLTKNYKDPKGAEFTELTISSNDARHVLCGYVNGKNSYGAFIGRKQFFVNWSEPQRDRPEIWTEGDDIAYLDRDSSKVMIDSSYDLEKIHLSIRKGLCEETSGNKVIKIESSGR